ncbi:MAG TPA: hypothetical protein VKY74_17395 [Chloroflexia bacterium]|nr:hypothetical protein [Chloroflexia bacterium]
MTTLRPALMIVIACSLWLTACDSAGPPPTATPSPSPSPVSAAALSVTSVEELSLPHGDLYLSPDGQQIAWVDKKQICVYTAAAVQQRCASIPAIIDANVVRWSPDSTRLVFTENLFLYFYKPHIWVLDAATGHLANLTAGGAATKIGPLTGLGGQIYVLALAPDGGLIAYNRDLLKTQSPDLGVWVARPDGTDPRHLVGDRLVTDIEFSPDGQALLAFSDAVVGQYALPPGVSSSWLVTLADGKEIPIDPLGAHWAAWAPTGEGLAYIVSSRRTPNTSGLYLAARPGSPGRQVYAEAVVPPLVVGGQYQTLRWAANNTILLQRSRDSKVVLVHLGIK